MKVAGAHPCGVWLRGQGPRSSAGGRKADSAEGSFPLAIDAFELFCAYHLGLARDGESRFLNLHHVAREFGVSPEVIRSALGEHAISPEQVLERDFDSAGAQADIAVAASVEERRALATKAWQNFREAEGSTRDWQAELDAAREEAEKSGM